jgi:hypothetical protein
LKQPSQEKKQKVQSEELWKHRNREEEEEEEEEETKMETNPSSSTEETRAVVEKP